MQPTGAPEQIHADRTNLNRIRKEKGISQVQLAASVGVTQASISMAARDPQILSFKNWEKIATALGVQVSDLLPSGTTFTVSNKVTV